MTAYYNEIDPAAVAVLRQLIEEGVIAPGHVDTRSIKEVQPDDLRGFAQCHFFAGGGLWSLALRMAGWHDARPVWTGSCPCQPFSAAGKGGGTDDPRHLWPDFHRLISACRPALVMGEQVAGAAGYGWFDGVRADLAREDYASRAVDFPACAVDAPHQRNRLYWTAVGLADADRGGRAGQQEDAQRSAQWRDASEWPDAGTVDQVDAARIGWREGRAEPVVLGGRTTAAGADASSVTQGDAQRERLEGQPRNVDDGRRPEQDRPIAEADGTGASVNVAQGHAASGSWPSSGRSEAHHREARSGQSGGSDASVGQADGRGWGIRDVGRPSSSGTASEIRGEVREQRLRADARANDHGRNGTYWSDAEWIVCHDGKARRAKPGLRLLVDGLPGRVDLWRVGGNAIVPQAAVEVIASLMDVLDLEDAA